MVARLEVITGPMFSGKSKEVIRRLERATFAHKSILVVKPGMDDRGTRNIFTMIKENPILKHYGLMLKKAVESPAELQEQMGKFKTNLLAIDEAQFLSYEFMDYILKLLEEKKDENFVVTVSGLNLDVQGRSFGIMPELFARADEPVLLTAICTGKCKGQNLAIFTQKVGGSKQVIEVGDANMYEARCRACFEPLKLA